MKKQFLIAAATIFAIGSILAPTAANASVSTCKSGYYQNSAHKCVHSPMKAPSVPSGASARCGDGTYSFSQSRSGTCSHHGGVSSWL